MSSYFRLALKYANVVGQYGGCWDWWGCLVYYLFSETVSELRHISEVL